MEHESNFINDDSSRLAEKLDPVTEKSKFVHRPLT